MAIFRAVLFPVVDRGVISCSGQRSKFLSRVHHHVVVGERRRKGGDKCWLLTFWWDLNYNHLPGLTLGGLKWFHPALSVLITDITSLSQSVCPPETWLQSWMIPWHLYLSIMNVLLILFYWLVLCWNSCIDYSHVCFPDALLLIIIVCSPDILLLIIVGCAPLVLIIVMCAPLISLYWS